VVPTDVASEGESVERLVIRSNYDKTAARYASDPAVQKALDGRQYAPTNDRHIVPPKTSLQMAETHGAFDELVIGNYARGPTSPTTLTSKHSMTAGLFVSQETAS
jgi:hypothetical protein